MFWLIVGRINHVRGDLIRLMMAESGNTVLARAGSFKREFCDEGLVDLSWRELLLKLLFGDLFSTNAIVGSMSEQVSERTLDLLILLNQRVVSKSCV